MSSTETMPSIATDRVRALAEFSLASLPAMRRPDGVFCFERRAGVREPLGRSPRYTLMVLLGLLRAQAAGYALPFDVDEVHAVAWRELEAGRMSTGDVGLMLWIDARRQGGRGEELVSRLAAELDRGPGLDGQVGMELGWIVTGLAHHVAATDDAAGAALLGRAVDQLLNVNRADSALFRHFGGPGRRRRFPNFATQIYSVLALAVVGGHGLDDRALPAARAAADRLLATQLPDGGWPWLFDAERGTVVERYEVYSVHQDAMAPMAFFELSEATGDPRYAQAAVRGLDWIYGANERGADMVDRANGLVLRSIRRRRGPDRAWLAAKTAASLLGLPARGSTARLTELNPTDRPYHFGWVLEAWCGREHLDTRRSAG